MRFESELRYYDKAVQDFKFVLLAEVNAGEMIEHLGFSCQQCIEKLLKAWLISSEKAPPRIHDLRILLKKCFERDEEAALPSDIQQILPELTQYAVHFRYEFQKDWHASAKELI